MPNLDRFEVFTFDCYGTLIDWETGLLTAFWNALRLAPDPALGERLLEMYAREEARLEAGPYRTYREILGLALRAVAGELGLTVSDEEVTAFAASVGDWPPFPDSTAALERLGRRYKLAVITNCDDDLFAASNGRLGVAFDWVITAQQARSYKPDPHNFELAFERIGLPPERILHVAQSLYHDRCSGQGARNHERVGESGEGIGPDREQHPRQARGRPQRARHGDAGQHCRA